METSNYLMSARFSGKKVRTFGILLAKYLIYHSLFCLHIYFSSLSPRQLNSKSRAVSKLFAEKTFLLSAF
jgi:hypothetical protein